MTDEEVDILQHLPAPEDKQAFLDEFWKSRDPQPGTEENEAKAEFEARVEYANRWFGTWASNRRRTNWEPGKHDNGWSSDRGKVYIILGPPDEVYFTNGEEMHFMPAGDVEDRWRYDDATMEIWYYGRYSVSFGFSKHSESLWILDSIDAQTMSVLNEAKLNWLSEASATPKKSLRFKAERRGGAIRITVPGSRISFKEEDGKLVAALEARIAVYRDYRKVAELSGGERYAFSEEELLAAKSVVLDVPFRPGPGRYYLDITLEETSAPSPSRYRKGLKFSV
jgi:GWxTD domain-containing protein